MAERKRMPDDMGEIRAKRIRTRFAGEATPSPEEAKGRQGAKLSAISVSKLRPHWLQPAERHSTENVRDLAESIRQVGLQEPPLVRRISSGRYEILAGHRRVRAWHLLALDGFVDEKIRVFVRSDLTDREAIYLIAAEYFHRREFSAIHTANVIGHAYKELEAELGREPSTRELAAILPWKKSSINQYLTIYEGLQDPRIGPLAHQMDNEPKSLIHQVLGARDFSTTLAALEAYVAGGPDEARKILKAARGGRPEGTVARKKRGIDGYDLTIRVRPTMSSEDAERALKALRATEEDLRRLVGAKKAQEAA